MSKYKFYGTILCKNSCIYNGYKYKFMYKHKYKYKIKVNVSCKNLGVIFVLATDDAHRKHVLSSN